MSQRKVELIYFDGCPNADRAREALRSVLESDSWTEWNLSMEETPDQFRSYGSPTVLVEGRDVTGESGSNAAMACRADGVPSPQQIREAVFGHD